MERPKVRALVDSLREFAAEAIDPRAIEERRWVGDEVIAGLGERGLMSLYVPEEYGGQGLSQTGYCTVLASGEPAIAGCRPVAMHDSQLGDA